MGKAVDRLNNSPTIFGATNRCGNRCVVVEQARWWRVQPTTEKLLTNYPIPPGHTHDWWQYDYDYFAPSFRQGGGRDTYKDGSKWP